MNLVGQAYDEPGSWGRLSNGWPSLEFKTKEDAKAAYKIAVKIIPYGCFVLVDRSLRLSTKEYVAKVKAKL